MKQQQFIVVEVVGEFVRQSTNYRLHVVDPKSWHGSRVSDIGCLGCLAIGQTHQRHGNLGGYSVHSELLIAPRCCQCSQALPQSAGCYDQLVNRHSGNHYDRRAGYAPAQRIGPARIDIVAIGKRLVAQQPVDRDEEQEQRCHEAPANLPISARRKANHIAYIIAETFRAIDPGDGNRLEKHGHQYGVAGSITIQQMKEIETALGAAGQADHKVQREQAGDEEFAILAYLGELVAQRGYDGLRATKLEEKKEKEKREREN